MKIFAVLISFSLLGVLLVGCEFRAHFDSEPAVTRVVKPAPIPTVQRSPRDPNPPEVFEICYDGYAICVVGLVAMSYISAANYGNRTEQGLLAKVRDNENVYGQGTQKIIEIAQVPAMYVADLTKVTQAAISGRYGADGSKAVFQMLKEQNPQIDSKMYTKIQQVIEAFRDEFKNNQTQMLDMRRSYETALGNVWQGFWLHTAGYPKTDMTKFDIVTTDKAEQTFKTHRDTGITLRPAP